MSDALIQRLVDFAESGNQQKIILDGQSHQGWVMEIDESGLLLSTGFSDKNGLDIRFNLEQIQQAELYYWDSQNDTWQGFHI